MAAAVITATTVQKRSIPTEAISGTAERRLNELYIEGPKATQNDWFLLSSYISAANCANVAQIYATVDGEAGGANVPVLDTFTYTSADAKIVVTNATTGVSRVRVLYWDE